MANTHMFVYIILSLILAACASNIYSDPCLDQTNPNQCTACLDTYIPTNDTLASLIGSGALDVTPVVYPPGSITGPQVPVDPDASGTGASDGIGLFDLPGTPAMKSEGTRIVVKAAAIVVVLVGWLVGH